MHDCLQLVHCHPGSQLQDIRRVKDAVNELAHVYAELKLMGAGLQYIDVGGGLGVDYDGSRTNYASSMNYTLAEYASDVVYRIASVCNARGIEHPMIVSESGPRHRRAPQRAGVQHARLLDARPVQRRRDQVDRGSARATRACRSRCATCSTPTARSPSGGWSSATTTRMQAREQALQMFNLGLPQPRGARPRRAAVLGDLRQDPRLLPRKLDERARGARGPRGAS